MRLLKIGLITISTTIIILIIALWVITTQINPNHYKSWIESTINKQTGLTLNIEGDLSWKFFPQIQLNVGRSQLNNPPSFNSTKLASFDQANLSVALFPLIKKDIQIQGISLVNANINLETNAKGQNNWEMLSELQKSNEQATQISEANFLLASHQNDTQNK
jgi:AsmA protein